MAPTDSDIFHPDAFVGLTHVTEPERRALSAVLDAGLVDLDPRRWGPRERRFTWWNHGLDYRATSVCGSTCWLPIQVSPIGWSRRGSIT